MNGLSDRFATWDAAYVLGALSPAERREYEEHLAGCPACQAAVSELAGTARACWPRCPPRTPPCSPRPRPRCSTTVRRRTCWRGCGRGRARRWRRTGALVGAAAALVLVLAGIAYAVGLLPFGSGDPRRVAFESVQPTGLTAVADVVPVKDGTKIEVQCAYGETNEPHPGGGYGNAEYTIYVVDRDGNATEIKRVAGQAQPDDDPRRTHATLKVRQIDAVEIRYAPSRPDCAARQPPLTPG